MWNSTDTESVLEHLTPSGFCGRYEFLDSFSRDQPYERLAQCGLPWAIGRVWGECITEPRYTDYTGVDGLADYLRSILDQATAKLSGRDALIFAAGMYQAAAPHRPRRANWGPKTHAACCQAMADLIMRETQLIDSDSHPWAYAY